MHHLHSLLHSLTCSEWSALQGYLTCFSEHDTHKNKYSQLANILMESAHPPTPAACCIKIYGAKNEGKFEMLKSRLKDKILDFLVTDISVDKHKDLDEMDLAVISICKKSAQFHQLYYSKKRVELLYNLLDEIISLSSTYERYSVLLDHLRFKKALAGNKKGRKEFELLDKKMDLAYERMRLANLAEHYYFEVSLMADFSGNLDKNNVVDCLEKYISEINRIILEKKIDSPITNYYLKSLEMSYFEVTNNYKKSRSVCIELLNVVRNSKSVYRKQRLGVVYDNLSRCEYRINEFDEAVKCAQNAQKYFVPGSENYCIALEQEFYALFALRQNLEALDVTGKMLLGATKKELGEFRFSKYNFLRANTLFIQKEFKEALDLLSEKRELSDDKSGWEIGARILQIMTLIEMLKLDEASRTINNLKRFIIRTDKVSAVSLRDKTILNMLLILQRAGFMFTSLNGSTHKHLADLSSNDPNLRWEPFTHEVIPFHEWLAGKMGRKALPVKAKKGLVAPVRKAVAQ